MAQEGMEKRLASLEALQAAQHQQNRGDIHRLFNGQQTILDAMRDGLDKIADKIGERCSSIEEEVIDLRLKWAKATGYAVAVSALGAVVFELVKTWIEKGLK